MSVAEQYGVKKGTVYAWLNNGAEGDNASLEMGKLRRENEALKSLLGQIVYEQEVVKKNWSRK